ncbi:MAG: hypothetical protein OEZ13_08060 [Spirochaetia bacterium]|nr:hypothetical protein [Spirochaetia bacterium]
MKKKYVMNMIYLVLIPILSCQKGPDKVYLEYAKASQNNDFQTLKKLSSKDIAAYYDEADKDTIKEYNDRYKKRLKDIKIIDVKIDNDKAILSVESFVKGEEGMQDAIEKCSVQMIKEEDGAVVNPQVVSFDFKSEALSNCLINKMRVWRFPAPPFEKPYYAFHTFRFHRQSLHEKKGELF